MHCFTLALPPPLHCLLLHTCTASLALPPFALLSFALLCFALYVHCTDSFCTASNCSACLLCIALPYAHLPPFNSLTLITLPSFALLRLTLSALFCTASIALLAFARHFTFLCTASYHFVALHTHSHLPPLHCLVLHCVICTALSFALHLFCTAIYHFAALHVHCICTCTQD